MTKRSMKFATKTRATKFEYFFLKKKYLLEKKIMPCMHNLLDCAECGGSSSAQIVTTKVKYNRKKCPHGRQKTVCRECGGSQICEHDRPTSYFAKTVADHKFVCMGAYESNAKTAVVHRSVFMDVEKLYVRSAVDLHSVIMDVDEQFRKDCADHNFVSMVE